MKLTLIFLIFILMNSCGFYSFNGASVDAKIKNIYIHYFQNQSENFKANLDRDLTEKLTDLILDQTNLQISNNNYEIEIIGKITEYEIFPISITSSDIANLNRLKISVEIEFVNNLNNKKNYKQKFSRFVDYKSEENIIDLEDELINQVLDEICIDIFNKTFVNW